MKERGFFCTTDGASLRHGGCSRIPGLLPLRDPLSEDFLLGFDVMRVHYSSKFKGVLVPLYVPDAVQWGVAVGSSSD